MKNKTRDFVRICFVYICLLSFYAFTWLWNSRHAEQPQHTLTPFPLHGSLLVIDNDQHEWYVVSFPDHVWKKLAKDAFMTADQYGAFQSHGRWKLGRANGNIHDEIDVKTGKETYSTRDSTSEADAPNTYELGKMRLQWDGQEWITTSGGKTSKIPSSDKSLAGPPDTWPDMAIQLPEVIFARRIYDKQSNPQNPDIIGYELFAVNTVTGKSGPVTSLGEGADFISDEQERTVYSASDDRSCEVWTWSGDHFRLTKSGHLPLVSDEHFGRLIEVVNQRWLLFEATIEDGSLLPEPPPPIKCYAYDLKTGNMSLLLDPPDSHSYSEVEAWMQE